MGIKEDIEKLVQKYGLKRHIFCGCVGGKHHLTHHGEAKNILKMLDQLRESIEEDADKGT